MNRTFLFLLAIVAALGGYLAYDLRDEKQQSARQEKENTLFPFPVEQVTDLILEKDGQTVHVVRSVDGWKVEAPFKDWADSSYTEDFVERAVKDKAVSVVKESENIDWKVYGLDRPVGLITLKTQTGETRRLEVSPSVDIDKNPFARLQGENRVLAVNTSWPVNVARTALDFRDKRLFRGKVGGIDRLVVQNTHGSFDLQNKDGQWVSPGQPKWKLDQNRVREVLSMLMQTQAQAFATEKAPTAAEKKQFGLLKPAVTLTAIRPEKTWQAEMAVGSGRGEYVLTSDPGSVLRLEPGSVEKFVALDLEDLRDKKQAFEFDTTLARKIEVETPIKKMSITEEKELRLFLDRLKASVAVGYAAGAQTSRFRPTSKLKVMDAEGKTVFEVSWGELVQKGTPEKPVSRRLARTSKLDEVILLDEITLQSWPLADQPQPEAAP